MQLVTTPDSERNRPFRDPRIRSEQFVQRVRTKGVRLLQEFRGMSRAPRSPGDDDDITGLRAGPEEDSIFRHAAEGRPRDREEGRFLRVASEDRNVEFPHAFLDALREAAEETRHRCRRHGKRCDEPEGSRSRAAMSLRLTAVAYHPI